MWPCFKETSGADCWTARDSELGRKGELLLQEITACVSAINQQTVSSLNMAEFQTWGGIYCRLARLISSFEYPKPKFHHQKLLLTTLLTVSRLIGGKSV